MTTERYANRYDERDVWPHEVVEYISGTELVVKEMFAKLVKGWVPKMILGLCVNEDEQDWTIKPQLRSVPGVAEVNSWGGHEKQYQVVIEPARLLEHDLTMADVTEALRRNNSNVGGGVVTRAGESLLVHGIGLVTTRDEIADIVIRAEDGVPIRIRDVADVEEGYEIRRGAVTWAGQGEAVLGLGFMLMGENTHEVTHRLTVRSRWEASYV